MTLDYWSLAKGQTKHKLFISYYHDDDEYYRARFEKLFGNLFINKSVRPGDIQTDTSTDYIKRLIQEDYITDASVLVVLVGPNTYKRKHVDWEISAALNKKVGGYSGLMGLCLPNHPNFVTQGYTPAFVPQRLVDNLVTGYANLYNWIEDAEAIKIRIDIAFEAREKKQDKIDNSHKQLTYNQA